MVKIKKRPMQVDEKFRKKILELRGHLLTKDIDKSSAILTREIINSPEFADIEKKILGNVQFIDVKINFDRRKK